MSTPLIVAIKRGSTQDGPGIRTVVFFKGCPLRCVFCQNPQAQDKGQDLVVTESRCVGCGACVEVCPEHAIVGPALVDRGRCTLCGVCVDACPSGALTLAGRHYALDELIDILLRDKPFFDRSKGGVTFSGGEPTMFPRFVGGLAARLRDAGVGCWIQTSGAFDRADFEHFILPHVEGVFFDVKFASEQEHRRYTGRSNRGILTNLAWILKQDVEVVVRCPLVPGMTDSEANLRGLVDLLSDLGVSSLTLLPYNPMGAQMVHSLGRLWHAPSSFYRPAELEELYAKFERILREKSLAIEGAKVVS